jgi:hypothetical protein
MPPPSHHSRRPLQLAREIVVIVYRLSARKPPSYRVSVDEVVRAVGSSAKFDEAIAFAVTANLLERGNGHSPLSLRVTADGVTRTGWRRTLLLAKSMRSIRRCDAE